MPPVVLAPVPKFDDLKDSRGFPNLLSYMDLRYVLNY